MGDAEKREPLTMSNNAEEVMLCEAPTPIKVLRRTLAFVSLVSQPLRGGWVLVLSCLFFCGVPFGGT